jgi:hypothetical protein
MAGRLARSLATGLAWRWRQPFPRHAAILALPGTGSPEA